MTEELYYMLAMPHGEDKETVKERRPRESRMGKLIGIAVSSSDIYSMWGRKDLGSTERDNGRAD